MRRRVPQFMFAVLALAVFLLAAWFTGCSPALLWARRAHLADIFGQMLPPDWGYFLKIPAPLWATVRMSVAGTALGAFGALLAAPLCARGLFSRPLLRGLFRALIQILRSFPTLILALAATFVFGLGAFAGTTAITVYTFAILTRLTYEDVETANLSACRALLAMGVSPARAYVRAVLPEIGASYLTNVLYLLETNVRHSAILGYVGAGGIGLLLNEKTSWREYDKVGAILLVLFCAVCLIELLSAYLTAIVKGERRLKKSARHLLEATLAALLLLSIATTDGPDFSHTSLHTVANMLSGLLCPDLEFFFRTDASGLGYLLLETVSIALAGTAIGAVVSLPLALLGAGRLTPKPVAAVFRAVCMAIRSIPFLIWGLIFIRVTGPGAFAGVLTMAVCSVGLLTKRFIEAIDALDMRAWGALAAMGVRPLLRLRWAALPQLAPAFASAVLYRFDVNLREASVLGLVGAGGVGAPLIFAMNHYDWREAGAICIALILLVWLVDLLSGRLRGGT